MYTAQMTFYLRELLNKLLYLVMHKFSQFSICTTTVKIHILFVEICGKGKWAQQKVFN